MIHDHPAPTDKPILQVIQNRWSPLAFSDQPLSQDQVKTLLEAARWAASSFNEQPWQYIVGYKGDETYEKIAQSLTEGNRWAKNAGVLMISVAKKFFAYNGKPNRHYAHDTGAASALMHLQATDMELYMHQMAGFDIEKIRHDFNVGEDHEPIAAIAIGYPGEHEALPENWKEREEAPRKRKSLDQMVWRG